MLIFFFSSRRRHTRWPRDWSSDVCSSDLIASVGQWRGVSSGDNTTWLECRTQFAETFGGGFTADNGIVGAVDFLGTFGSEDGGRHWEDLGAQAAFFGGCPSALLRLCGKGVLVFARNAVALCDDLCGGAHGGVGFWVAREQLRVDRELVSAHGYHSHGFASACDTDIDIADLDGAADLRDGLEARRAEAVGGHAGYGVRQTCELCDDTTDVVALLCFGEGATDDDVFDLVGVEAFHGIDGCAHGQSTEGVWARVAELAAVRSEEHTSELQSRG